MDTRVIEILTRTADDSKRKGTRTLPVLAPLHLLFLLEYLGEALCPLLSIGPPSHAPMRYLE